MRFSNIKPNLRAMIYTWCLKEFKNLQRLQDAGVRVPSPIAYHKNLLVMEEILLDGEPAPTLKQMRLSKSAMDEVAKAVLAFMKKMYKNAELVHCDLSEYNILLSNDGPVIIDVGQAVLLTHPHAEEYLQRDIGNIVRFFKGCREGMTVEKVHKYVTGHD
jgi:RIO kinase 1